jgi:membrane-associated protease RseP (regulator of RpoE activity)
VSTLAGDRSQSIGRLTESLNLADYLLPAPIVELSDELSAIGGAVLQNFSVTFDQERDRVTFYRDSPAPIATAPRRSPGLSFSKTPAYWRVAGVVPNSSAAAAAVERGDLITRINGEPVARWDFRRYARLVAEAREITFTFLNGTRETEKRLPVFELVP